MGAVRAAAAPSTAPAPLAPRHAGTGPACPICPEQGSAWHVSVLSCQSQCCPFACRPAPPAHPCRARAVVGRRPPAASRIRRQVTASVVPVPQPTSNPTTTTTVRPPRSLAPARISPRIHPQFLPLRPHVLSRSASTAASEVPTADECRHRFPFAPPAALGGHRLRRPAGLFVAPREHQPAPLSSRPHDSHHVPLGGGSCCRARPSILCCPPAFSSRSCPPPHAPEDPGSADPFPARLGRGL